MACQHGECCGFFHKFQSKKSPVWKAMIKRYCEGDGLCVRRIIFNTEKTFPSDDLMPVGVYASKAFLSLP